MRVIGADGSQMGVMSASAALKLAEDANLDLVKIAPTANPPVCRVMDYGKYRFEQAKKEKENRKNQKVVETKEVVTEVRKDNDYSKITISGIEGKITKVGEPTIVKTKSFKDIVASELVCDVKDDYAATKNGNLSEATYRLIPKQ